LSFRAYRRRRCTRQQWSRRSDSCTHTCPQRFGFRGRCHCRHRRGTATLLWQFEGPKGLLKFLTEVISSTATVSRLRNGCPTFCRCCKRNLKIKKVHKITACCLSVMFQLKCFLYRLTYWHT
jgi:hypothetical protein